MRKLSKETIASAIEALESLNESYDVGDPGDYNEEKNGVLKAMHELEDYLKNYHEGVVEAEIDAYRSKCPDCEHTNYHMDLGYANCKRCGLKYEVEVRK